MRSSGSTPSPPGSGPIRLYLFLAREDHPKACTGRYLLHRGLVRELRGPPTRPVPLLLDPHAEQPLSPRDRAWVDRSGLLAVDCSWNRLRDRGGYPDEERWLGGIRERRRLPWLIATNPQHFGRLTELNTAEALAAAVWILGAPEQARRLLAGLRGGTAFFDINGAALTAFAGAPDAPALKAEETRIYGGVPAR
jgi:pre-rRNA-processing protein TSR3